MIFRLLICCSFFGLFGCATTLKSPTAPLVSKERAIGAYAEVLEKYVDSRGHVDFRALAKNMKPLQTYLRFVSETPFSSFKTENSLLAHYINSYNALSMNTVIQRDFPESHSGLSKVGFFYLTKMKIGGTVMSLYAYENDYIRKLGEEKVHFALNCMAESCPKLPNKPIPEATAKAELKKLATFFFSEPRNLKLDPDKKKVYVSEILSFFTEDFVPAHGADLKSYVNKFLSTPIPEEYELDFVDYDWTVIYP